MGTPKYGQMASGQEKKRQKLVTEGTASVNKAFSGFGPDFYNERAKSYVDYAMPQLADQYQQVRNSQLFGMSNRGLLGGSANQQQFSNLNKKMSQNKQSIVDSGIGQAQDLQRQIEGNRTNLLNMVMSGADPAGAGSQAINTAASFTPHSLYAPLANMFGDVANSYYMSQMMNNYKQMPTNSYGAPGYSVTGGGLPNPTSSNSY